MMSDVYPATSCAMLVAQWRSVCALKMPKLLLMLLLFSCTSRWIAANLPCSSRQYSGFAVSPTSGQGRAW